MKLLFSEFPASYETYSFPYQVWAIEDNKIERESLLNQGFLPSRMKTGLWYVARSLRVNIDQFSLSSENKRVINNTSECGFTIVRSSDFKLQKNDIEWIQKFSKQKFESGGLSEIALRRIFTSLSDQIFVWRNHKDEIIGYVPVMKTEKSLFYWFAFYKEEEFVTGLGTRMMLEVINWAVKEKLVYVYLGTVYSNSSLYKINFNGFEFFNGFAWSSNKEELKYLIGKDPDKNNPQLLKDDNYQKRFHECDNLTEFLQKLK